MFTNVIPVDVTLLGEDENHGMPLVGQVGIVILGGWTDVRVVSFIQSGNSIVSRLLILIFRLVIEQRDLKMALARDLLQQGKICVGIGRAVAVPINYERRNSKASSMVNLLAEHSGVMAGVTNIHMGVVSEPWHVDSQQRRQWRWVMRGQGMIGGGRIAPFCDRKTRHHQTQQRFRQLESPFFQPADAFTSTSKSRMRGKTIRLVTSLRRDYRIIAVS
jgi:hypothetical protein